MKIVPSLSKEVRECFYCHKQGHLIADCNVLKRKQQTVQMKSVGLVNAVPHTELFNLAVEENVPNVSYKPFLTTGFILLSDDGNEQK